MAFPPRLSESERARHWNENFAALLAAVRARYIEKDEVKVQIEILKGAAAMAAWDTAEIGAEAALRGINGP